LANRSEINSHCAEAQGKRERELLPQVTPFGLRINYRGFYFLAMRRLSLNECKETFGSIRNCCIIAFQELGWRNRATRDLRLRRHNHLLRLLRGNPSLKKLYELKFLLARKSVQESWGFVANRFF